jgi:hypothetical protein
MPATTEEIAMPNREPTQDQNQQLRNPGTFSRDDDEAQEADISRVSEQDIATGQRQAGNLGDASSPEENLEEVEDADDDVDDIDDEDDDEEPIGGRP